MTEFKIVLNRFIVYSDGQILSINKRRVLELQPDSEGYLMLRNGREKKSIHRIVAETFIPNPENKPQVNHKNGIKTDNRVLNLEWCTQLENMRHAFSTGLIGKGERASRSKLKTLHVRVIREALHKGYKNCDIARYFKVDASTICDIKSGKSWASV